MTRLVVWPYLKSWIWKGREGRGGGGLCAEDTEYRGSCECGIKVNHTKAIHSLNLSIHLPPLCASSLSPLCLFLNCQFSCSHLIFHSHRLLFHTLCWSHKSNLKSKCFICVKFSSMSHTITSLQTEGATQLTFCVSSYFSNSSPHLRFLHPKLLSIHSVEFLSEHPPRIYQSISSPRLYPSSDCWMFAVGGYRGQSAPGGWRWWDRWTKKQSCRSSWAFPSHIMRRGEVMPKGKGTTWSTFWLTKGKGRGGWHV